MQHDERHVIDRTPLWPALDRRCRLPELMDNPTLDEDAHFSALDGLRRINIASRSAAIVWPKLRSLTLELKRPLKVLDVASGGGDLVVTLSQWASSTGIDLQVDGCDVSERALDYAEDFAKRNSPFQNRFFQCDVLSDELPSGYDVVMCSLFLHHLPHVDAALFLQKARNACTSAVLVNDLRRTRMGYLLAHFGGRILTRSPIVHVDGPLSVRAAWTTNEVRGLAAEAGMANAQVSFHWPQRFLLFWRKT